MRGEKNRQDWMDGRAIFIFPESRPSNVTKRNIVEHQSQHDRMNEIENRETDDRRLMLESEIKAEIDAYYQALEEERREQLS